MSTVRIQREIDSTTLTIPELAEFVGQKVEITVRPQNPKPTVVTKGRGWDALLDIMENPGDYDFDIAMQARERERAMARKA